MMFTCSYTDSEALLREFYRKVKLRRTIMWAWVALVLALGCLVFFFLSRELWDLIVPALGGYYTLKQFLTPGQTARKEMRQLHYRFDGKLPPRVCTVDEKGAVSIFDGEEKRLRFEDVLAVYELKSAIVLEGMDTAIVMAKEGFEAGQLEPCLAHIKKSCPNCPHYKR